LRPPANQPRLFIRAASQARVNVPIYWIIVSIAHALTFYRRSQERESKAVELQARLTDAKLQALRMQLHPHFLFNTLNAISTLVHKEPAAADEMIANLSELLRATLDTTTQEISLRQELNLLSRYLEIQQARFGQRLRVEKEIDAASLAAQVPTLVLQPIVENAIRHGVEPNPAPGVVKIGAHLKQGTVRLTVQNNGINAKPAANEREGIGIANTRARLEALYGEQARLVLSSSSEGGFTVEIELPFHEKPAAQ
jgi:LytS/YehU family sensor histidine kinase